MTLVGSLKVGLFVVLACVVAWAPDLSRAGAAARSAHVQRQATLQLSAGEASPGDQITVTGEGYQSCVDSGGVVQLTWDGDVVPADVSVDGDGLSARLLVPDGAAEGSHTIGSQCYLEESGYGSTQQLANATLTVVPPASTPDQSSTSPTPGSTSPTPGSTPPTTGSAPPSGSSGTGGPSLALIVVAIIGALVLLVLVAVLLRPRHPVRGQVRIVARPLGAPSVALSSLSGVQSVSIQIEPHIDYLGHQTLEEVAR